jgi:hypothetical protein
MLTTIPWPLFSVHTGVPKPNGLLLELGRAPAGFLAFLAPIAGAALRPVTVTAATTAAENNAESLLLPRKAYPTSPLLSDRALVPLAERVSRCCKPTVEVRQAPHRRA